MDTVIKIENLSKLYRLGEIGTGTISHDLNRWWQTKIMGKEDPYTKIGQVNDRTQQAAKGEHIWALKDISLEVKQGEVLGIIGKNGAGKSTLLKLLSRVTSPTTGSIKTKGRLAALLEVGTGFHPEMTGRENIYMNGTIMGMRKWEITEKLDEIVEFAGVTKYLDTPTKRYSSGMTVRLGFAIAAFLEPEILVVDEVLAVGDAEFQKKAIGKMQDVSKGEGRTVLFVSHNMGSVRKLCDRGLVLQNGEIAYDGTVDSSIDYYLREPFQSNKISQGEKILFDNEDVSLVEIFLVDSKNNIQNEFTNLETIKVIQRIIVKEEITNFKFGIELEDQFGIKIMTSYHNDLSNKNEFTILKVGEHYIECILPEKVFNEGKYYVNSLLGEHRVRWIYQLNRILNFSINFTIENQSFSANKRNSLLAPMLTWDIN